MSAKGTQMKARHPDARERRIAREQDRERVRAALRAGAHHGFYVFDGLMTDEAGMLDFLVVGSIGVGAVVVRGEHGDVEADPDTGELYLIRSPFEDDPRRQMREQREEVKARLPEFVPAYSLICFTRAEIKDSGNPEADRGLYNVWGLPKIFDEEQYVLTPAEVDDIARKVESIYARPPFVRPGEPYGGETI